ncbi:MAG: signal peptidase I [Gammaproteobacteria bacterium]|nr:MAG: signal peptidase I [Gammaproteobacteria bacterium]RLA54791.1 MAG: signal peptidase I [Gammaproteobacteria bacterium]
MDIDFPLILVVLTGLAGAMWLLDRFYLSARRGKDKPAPWFVESTAPFFPVLLIVLVVRSFLVEPFQIPSGSMIPTLEVGDFILVNKFSYGLRLPVTGTKVIDVGEPKHGDVMVFVPPNDDRYFIKRVVGLPGDEVRFIDNYLYVNGKKMAQENIPEGMPGVAQPPANYKVMNEELDGVEHLIRKQVETGRYGRNFLVVVPEGHYFMVGDNRDNSHDSRAWGAVPEKNIVGKAFAIWMHWEKVLSLPGFDRVGTIR